MGPDNKQQNAMFEVWCAEDGADGKVPKPDGWNKDKNGPWIADQCADGKAWAYSFKRSRWYWVRSVSPQMSLFELPKVGNPNS